MRSGSEAGSRCSPETLTEAHCVLQVSYLFDDVGIPADYRHINGSSVHTYSLISSSGKVTFVKFHWLPTLGGHTYFLNSYAHNTWPLEHHVFLVTWAHRAGVLPALSTLADKSVCSAVALTLRCTTSLSPSMYSSSSFIGSNMVQGRRTFWTRISLLWRLHIPMVTLPPAISTRQSLLATSLNGDHYPSQSSA